MLSVAVAIGIVAIGLPWLTRLRGGRDLVDQLAMAATVGLCGQILVSVVLARVGALSTGGVLAGLVAISLVPLVGLPVGEIRARASSLRWASPWAVLPVAVAALVPKSATYFVFLTGDMGEYVNQANAVADGAELVGGFPHGFTVTLVNAHLLLGEASVDVVTPALGLLLVLQVVALARRLGAHPWAAAGIGLLAAVHPVVVWFSVFPVSELLYAVILLGVLHLLAVARSVASLEAAVVAGVACGVLLFVRGSAFLVAGAIVPAFVLSVLVDDDARRRVHSAFTFTAITGLLAAYAYNVKYLPLYFVDNQLTEKLPADLVREMARFQLLGPSRILAAVLVVGTLVLAAIAYLVGWRLPPTAARRRWAVPAAVAVTTVLTTVVVFREGTGGIVDSFDRWGPPLLGLAAGGIIVLVVAARQVSDALVATTGVLVGASGVGLFAQRVREDANHAYHLYQDRYLLSEGLPVALMLAAIGLSAITVMALHRSRAAGAAATVLAVGFAAVVVVDDTAKVIEHRVFGDAYSVLDAVADVAPEDDPIIYHGPDEPPSGWFFQNTFRALGLPLELTFGREVVNVPLEPFGPDPQPDVSDVRRVLAARDGSTVTVLAVREPGDPRLTLHGVDSRLVAEIPYVGWNLKRRRNQSEERWQRYEMVLDVFRVSADT